MVQQQLELLDVSKSPGPDGIHPKLLRRFSNMFACPLYLIFSKSLQTGILPSDWKLADIVPLHKQGSRVHAKNYRPVSLTSVVVKLLESIIKPIILNHLISNNIIHDKQHGFLPGKSCVTSLLEVVEEWTLAIDKGWPLDVIYTAWTKVFVPLKVFHSNTVKPPKVNTSKK